MIYLDLFLTFLKIGALTFGGGYAMIALIREEVLAHGWMDEALFADMIAVSESTPGPIAINMATFVGSTQGGILGSLVATLGVVFPSFAIILLIAAVLKNVMKYAGVNAFLSGLRPVVAALITATAVTMILPQVFGIEKIGDEFVFEWKQAAIFAVVALIGFLWKKLRGKKISPILLILLSAGFGMILYGVIQ